VCNQLLDNYRQGASFFALKNYVAAKKFNVGLMEEDFQYVFKAPEFPASVSTASSRLESPVAE
jgi:hypothetical protein